MRIKQKIVSLSLVITLTISLLSGIIISKADYETFDVITSVTSGGYDFGINKTSSLGQVFTYNADNLAKFDILARRANTAVLAGTLLKCSIYVAGTSTYTVGEALASATCNTDDLPLNVADPKVYGWATFDFPDITTVSGTKYVAIIEFVDKAATGDIGFKMSISSTVVASIGGCVSKVQNTAGVWSIRSDYTSVDRDICFKAYKSTKYVEDDTGAKIAVEQTKGSYVVGINKTKKIAQSFTTNATNLVKIAFSAYKDANIASNTRVKCSVFATGTDGFPTGSALTAASFSASSLPLGSAVADCQLVEIDLPNIQTTPKTKYIAVLEFEDTSALGNVGFKQNCNEPFYTGGNLASYNGAWSVAYPDYDMYFSTYTTGTIENETPPEDDTGAKIAVEQIKGAYVMGLNKTKKIAQSFTTNATNLVRIGFQAYKTDAVLQDTIIKCTIFVAGENKFPIGDALTSATFNSNFLSVGNKVADCKPIEIDLLNIQTTVHTKYIAVLEFEDPSAPGDIGFKQNCNEPFYLRGSTATYKYGSWIIENADYDLYFQAYTTGTITVFPDDPIPEPEPEPEPDPNEDLDDELGLISDESSSTINMDNFFLRQYKANWTVGKNGFQDEDIFPTIQYVNGQIIVESDKTTKYNLGQRMYYNKSNLENKTLSFTVTIVGDDKTAFSLRDSDPGVGPFGKGQNKSYEFWIVPLADVDGGIIHLQRFSGSQNMNELTTEIVSEEVIKPGPHKIETGAIDVEGGVRVFMKIDGQMIIDYTDTSPNRIKTQGKFCLINIKRMIYGAPIDPSLIIGDEERSHLVKTEGTFGSTSYSVNATTKVAQSFKIGSDKLSRVKVKMAKSSDVPAGTLIKGYIYAQGEDKLSTGNALGQATVNSDLLKMNNNYTWLNFDFGESPTIKGKRYIVVIEYPSDKDGTVYIEGSGTDFYLEGQRLEYKNNAWLLTEGELKFVVFKPKPTNEINDTLVLEQSAGSHERGLSKNWALGQSFIYPSNQISRIELCARNPENMPVSKGMKLKVELYRGDDNNFPTGDPLASVLFNTSVLPVTASPIGQSWFGVNFPVVETIPGEVYVIVVDFADKSASGSLGFKMFSNNGFVNGYMLEKINNQWVYSLHIDQNPVRDLAFRIYAPNSEDIAVKSNITGSLMSKNIDIQIGYDKIDVYKNMMISEFLENIIIENDVKIVFYDADGQRLTDEDYIKNAAILKISADDLLLGEYSIVSNFTDSLDVDSPETGTTNYIWVIMLTFTVAAVSVFVTKKGKKRNKK